MSEDSLDLHNLYKKRRRDKKKREREKSYEDYQDLTDCDLSMVRMKKSKKLRSLHDSGTLLSPEEFQENRLKEAANAIIDQELYKAQVKEEITDLLRSPTLQTNNSPSDNKSSFLYNLNIDIVVSANKHEDDIGAKYGVDSYNTLKRKKRRTIENYENLCKTLLDTPESNKESQTPPPGIFPKGDRVAGRLRGGGHQPKASNNQTKTPLDGGCVTIRHCYRMPSRKNVPSLLIFLCRYILEQEVKVSPLNQVYRGHCQPEKIEKDDLREKFRAKFGRYYHEEDQMILTRLYQLEKIDLVTDRNLLCQMIKDNCGRFSGSKRNLGVRNILGLWVGQDIPHKIAYLHCQRLLTLILGSSLEHPPCRKWSLFSRSLAGIVEDDDSRVVENRSIYSRWTEEENIDLMELVLIDQKTDRGTRYLTLEQLIPMELDWDGISTEFPKRTAQGVREHWYRTLHPALIQEYDPEDILAYRRLLVQSVQEQKAAHRKEIDWNLLEKEFFPKSKASMQKDFHDLTRYSCGTWWGKVETSTDFHRRLRLARNDLDQLEQLSPKEVLRKFKGVQVKKRLYDHYVSLTN